MNGGGTPGPDDPESSSQTVPELEPTYAPVPEFEPAHRTVPERRSFEFTGVEMVKGPPQVMAVAGDLSVRFDDLGITISGQEPGERHVMPWADVEQVRFEDSTTGPSGGVVTPVEVDSNGATVRLLLGGDRQESLPVVALETRLPAWTHPGAGAQADDHPTTDEPAGGTPEHGAMPPVDGSLRPARRRRLATLVVGLALIGAGIGLAFGLAGGSGSNATVSAPTPSPDQQLADRLMLTRSDLPVGWRVAAAGSGQPDLDQRSQAAITHTFAGCMGLSDPQASALLGSKAPDQTAQSASPIFEAPPTADQGYAVQLQTAASIVRTPGDEQRDFGPFADHRYPACAATATAAELQLGVNTADGTHDPPGASAAAPLSLPARRGEQVHALRITCQVADRRTAVPVEVVLVFLGSGRIEADLESFAIGGPVPNSVLSSSAVAFEGRVATDGREVQL